MLWLAKRNFLGYKLVQLEGTNIHYFQKKRNNTNTYLFFSFSLVTKVILILFSPYEGKKKYLIGRYIFLEIAWCVEVTERHYFKGLVWIHLSHIISMWSARAGVCRLNSVWRKMGVVLLIALNSSTIIFGMRAATWSQWRSQRRGLTWENSGRSKTRHTASFWICCKRSSVYKCWAWGDARLSKCRCLPDVPRCVLQRGCRRMGKKRGTVGCRLLSSFNNTETWKFGLFVLLSVLDKCVSQWLQHIKHSCSSF